MADSTLSALPSKTVPVGADLLFITDSADTSQSPSGTSKNVTISNLLTSFNIPSVPVSVANGGTGATTLTAGSVLVGNGTLAVSLVATTGTGNVVLATSPTLTTPVISSISNTGTLTLPTSTDTLIGRATADTLTNKDVSAASNVFPASLVTLTGNQILTNKTLTAPVIATISNTGTVTLPTATDTLVGRATTDTLTNKTLTSPVLQGNVSGWISVTDTWTYASATTITVPSDATTVYDVGDRIQLTQTTVKYFYIVAVTATVLTITGGSDYTLVNAAISAISYSKQATPHNFPQWFNYTATWGGFSAAPTNVVSKFTINGRTCIVQVSPGNSGTSNATSSTVTAPIATATLVNKLPNCATQATDNSTPTTTPGLASIASGASTINLYKDFSATNNWTASGGKLSTFVLTYDI